MHAGRVTTALRAAAMLATVALALAACSSGSDEEPTAAPTVTVTATETVTQSPVAEPSGSAEPSRTQSPAAAGPECATDELRARVRELDSGAGQRNAAIVLTNVSDRSCQVTGYPGLQLVSADGSNVPTRVVRVAEPAPRTLAVAPGARVSSAINIGVVATGNEPATGPCQPTPTAILVTPPDQTTSLTARWTLGSVCNDGRIKANALVAGNGS